VTTRTTNKNGGGWPHKMNNIVSISMTDYDEDDTIKQVQNSGTIFSPKL